MKTFIITFVTLLLICDGCGDRSYLELTKISDKKNTFELKGAYFRVFSVNVIDISDSNDYLPKTVWSIRSEKGIGGTQFRITVPEIPDGFVQVTPKPPENFQLRNGQLYEVDVIYGGGTGPAGCKWVAE